MSWSRHGYENASYCISHTGRHPAMQRPTAAPRMPASASGVSKQRSAPKRSRRPAVARNTPPARPTSSPRTITSASRSSSTWNASLIASTIESSATEDPPQLREVRPERRGRIDEGVLEQQRRIRRRFGPPPRNPLPHQTGRPRPDLRRGRLVEHAEPLQVALVTADALVLLLLLDALEVDVRLRVVSRGVRRGAIRHRLDEGRPAAGARALHRLARRLVHGEDVTAVDADAGHAVAGRLVGQRLRVRLRGEGRRDRPLVVVAEEDERRLRDGCEVRALVERALGR